MADTDITFVGVAHQIGQSVEVVIGGLDCGAHIVVSPGTVTVPLASIPIPEGYPDAGTYFQTLDVGPYDKTTYGDATNQVTMQIDGGGRATMYLPVYIGFLYPGIAQVMRPLAPPETKSQTGGATGKLRRVWSVAAMVTTTQGLNIGTTPINTLPAPLNFANALPFPINVLYNGVVYMTVEDNDSFDGMPLIYVPGPYPCILNTLTGFTEFKERV